MPVVRRLFRGAGFISPRSTITERAVDVDEVAGAGATRFWSSACQMWGVNPESGDDHQKVVGPPRLDLKPGALVDAERAGRVLGVHTQGGLVVAGVPVGVQAMAHQRGRQTLVPVLMHCPD